MTDVSLLLHIYIHTYLPTYIYTYIGLIDLVPPVPGSIKVCVFPGKSLHSPCILYPTYLPTYSSSFETSRLALSSSLPTYPPTHLPTYLPTYLQTMYSTGTTCTSRPPWSLTSPSVSPSLSVTPSSPPNHRRTRTSWPRSATGYV